MRRNSSFSLIRWLSIGLIIMAVFLLTVELVSYSQIRAAFPAGLKIAGVPVGELDYEHASERLLNVFLSPIEVNYGSAAIQIRPAVLGFEPQLERMLAAADKQRVTESFWIGFWKNLWNQPQSAQDIPLQAKIDEERILSYLRDEISPRYDQPATPPMPIPGESGFYAGAAGTELDMDRAVLQVIQTLESSSNRTVNLTYRRTSVPRPSFLLLEIMLKDIINASPFDGIVEIYLQDLNSNQTLNFVYSQGQEDELPTGIAFSSWSTIKIPVMVTAFTLIEEPHPPEFLDLIEKMVEQSDNDSTDKLASTLIEQYLAPLIVTEDMQTLGLENTFWAGYFYSGATLLRDFKTPANQRTDYNTELDRYAQTTATDMGLLLQDIYFCAERGGGSLIAAFEGKITQNECRLMVEYLALNRIGVLIQAGVPGGITVAHKHGWAYEIDDGYIHTIADVALVYTPGGNYILTIFAHHPIQAVFDPVNILMANLSSAVYNYINLQTQ